jgi:toxin ParE1/3/4
MSLKRVIARALAESDVDDAVAGYLKEHKQEVALRFVDAIEDAYGLLGRHPAIGPSYYAHELDIPGLQSWSLPRFPYVIFYIDQADHVAVLRLLHARRDIPALMQNVG